MTPQTLREICNSALLRAEMRMKESRWRSQMDPESVFLDARKDRHVLEYGDLWDDVESALMMIENHIES